MAKIDIGGYMAKIDIDDDDAVLAAMAKELKEDPENLSISEGNYSGFGVTVKTIEMGRQEYMVVQDDDAAHEMALAMVKDQLESEPEMFNQSFIESHINIDRLRRDLLSDVQSSRYDDLKDELDRTTSLKFMKQYDIEIPEPTEAQKRDWALAMADEKPPEYYLAQLEDGDAEDRWIEIGDEPEVPDSEIERIADEEAETQLKDPVEYLQDIYGKEDGIKQAIEMAGIDVNAAAEQAVRDDGAGHFLGTYDGNLNDGPGGLVYWRHN